MYTAGKISACPDCKNHLPCRARNHKSLYALRQDLHALGMRARLNVEPHFMITTSIVILFPLRPNIAKDPFHKVFKRS